jgi:hypothetical protein
LEAAQLLGETTRGTCAGVDVAVSVGTITTGTLVAVGDVTNAGISDGEVVIIDWDWQLEIKIAIPQNIIKLLRDFII